MNGRYEGRVTLHIPIPSDTALQRARGVLSITARRDHAHVTRLENLRQEGSLRAIFPRPSAGKLDAVAINTAGGVTGGDRFAISVTAHENAQVSITTQAAERIYRASKGAAGHITNQISVAANARLHWLPQETILFDGCNLHRTLDVDVAATGSALILEPLVFGRAASGEALQACAFDDRITITSNEQPLYLDRIRLTGDIASKLTHPAIANGARAMANIVCIAPDAQRLLAPCRDLLPATAGASLLSDRVLVVRMLAPDSYALRTALLPILTLFTHNTLPKNWRL